MDIFEELSRAFGGGMRGGGASQGMTRMVSGKSQSIALLFITHVAKLQHLSSLHMPQNRNTLLHCTDRRSITLVPNCTSRNTTTPVHCTLHAKGGEKTGTDAIVGYQTPQLRRGRDRTAAH